MKGHSGDRVRAGSSIRLVLVPSIEDSLTYDAPINTPNQSPNVPLGGVHAYIVTIQTPTQMTILSDPRYNYLT
jgi:hypothetical protein